MTYRITRNGQIFGPYTEAEVRQYVASGNISGADLIQTEGSAEWAPVSSLFASAAPPQSVTQQPLPQVPFAGPPSAGLYPDPPDLPWWVALLLGLVTGGIFFVIWDIVQASWVRRVQPASNALALYIAMAVLYVVRLPSSWHTIDYNVFGGPAIRVHHGFLAFLVWLGLYLASRTVIRQDLLRHFNVTEPLGLRLNAFFVYVLGGLYLQYHFNRINELKRAMHVSVPA